MVSGSAGPTRVHLSGRAVCRRSASDAWECGSDTHLDASRAAAAAAAAASARGVCTASTSKASNNVQPTARQAMPTAEVMAPPATLLS